VVGGVKGGVVGGVVGGTVGGVLGGVLGGTLGGPPPPVPKRLEFDGRMTPPKLVSGPQIEYTQKALENDVEGVMLVKCVLTTSGEVKDCQAVQSLRFMERAVLDVLQKRRYTPVTLQGHPVEVYYTFRIRLTLPT
jgi:protein TonB